MNPSKHSSAADLQVRKRALIELLTHVDDEKTIKEVEALLQKKRVANYEKSLKPMTEAELLKRIGQSEKDVKEGRVLPHSEVKKLIATW